jgi:hypothetical protein
MVQLGVPSDLVDPVAITLEKFDVGRTDLREAGPDGCRSSLPVIDVRYLEDGWIVEFDPELLQELGRGAIDVLAEKPDMEKRFGVLMDHRATMARAVFAC